MKSILIIIPYFGKLPELFQFWYHSALNNPDVDFILFTDQNVEPKDNIRVVKTSFEDIKSRFSEALGMDLALTSPYKLCDFRPAYGYIFAEELKGYDFWGFCDVDLVFGRIRNFITGDILDNYDMISCWGHLTLYRNCDFCNTLFMSHHEGYLYYKDVFSNPDNMVFDEIWSGTAAVMRDFHGDRQYRCEGLFDDIVVPTEIRHFKSSYSWDRNCLTFIYKDNALYRVYFDKWYRRYVEPTMYAHFQKRHGWIIDTDDYSDYIIYPDVFRRPFRFLQGVKLTWLGRSKTAHLF